MERNKNLFILLICYKKTAVSRRSPEVFFLGSEYLQATKRSGGNIIKKVGNVKSFIFLD